MPKQYNQLCFILHVADLPQTFALLVICCTACTCRNHYIVPAQRQRDMLNCMKATSTTDLRWRIDRDAKRDRWYIATKAAYKKKRFRKIITTSGKPVNLRV